ncbi:MAG: hypothetical protein J6L89_03410 [Clostridia bacterium]|nr:hypothetical protein [Clostridia bacterium]
MDKKQIALNKWFNFDALSGVCLVLFGCFFIGSEEKSLGALVIAGGIFIFTVALVAEPICYVFDSSGVSLIFAFYKKERYLWKNIRFIRIGYNSTGHKLSIPTPSGSTFVFDGKVEGEEKWYMKHYVRKSIRTKHLIEKYWDGTVTGYEFENIKKKIEKWQGKKEKQIDAHFADEVVKAEREARARIREAAKPYIEKAKTYNLDMKVKFYYVTSDGEELNSRPEDGYIYTACAEISHSGETDEDRVVMTDEDLLYVRMTKTGYKYSENKKSAVTFTDALETVISVINEKGIEYYCD